MRLLTFKVHGQTKLGAEQDNQVLDLNQTCQLMLAEKGEPSPERLADALLPSDMVQFLQGGSRCLQTAYEAIEFLGKCKEESRQAVLFSKDEVDVLAPVLNPGKILCVGRNYKEHVREMKHSDLPEFPVLFAKFSNTIAAHNEPIPVSKHVTQFDYEAELAVVIGRSGRDIEKDKALDYVAGYMCLNDLSARDWQTRTPQWLQGKSFDKAAPMGPVLVTADEIPDPQTLEVRQWVNGELRQSAHTSQMIFDVTTLVSYISQVMTLEPGDIIATGTPSGVGAGMNPKSFLKPGDTVRVEIERIGQLDNRIV